MSSIILLLSTGFIAYLIDTVFVSMVLALHLSRKKREASPYLTLFILFLAFAFLDLYPWPAFLSLNATFTIENQALANFLEVKPNMRLAEFISIGFFDLTIWFVQAGFAFGLGQWLRVRKNC